jgi:hypothetical protein
VRVVDPRRLVVDAGAAVDRVGHCTHVRTEVQLATARSSRQNCRRLGRWAGSTRAAAEVAGCRARIGQWWNRTPAERSQPPPTAGPGRHRPSTRQLSHLDARYRSPPPSPLRTQLADTFNRVASHDLNVDTLLGPANGP